MTAVTATRARTPVALLATIAAAWLVAIAAEVTGRAHLLHHDTLIESSLPPLVGLVIFLAAWQLMIAAMMLPSTLPMMGVFTAASSGHDRPAAAQAAFLGGYATVWTAFGAAAFMLDTGIHRTVDATPWLGARPWLVAGVLLFAAGAAQFLPLTKACLRSCRHPFAYLMQHYRPGTGAAYDFGRSHGLYCLGCCWGLMLVMFAAGVANIAWMGGLTAIMVYEKAGRHGEGLVPVTGTFLMVWSVLVLVHPGWLPAALSGVR